MNVNAGYAWARRNVASFAPKSGPSVKVLAAVGAAALPAAYYFSRSYTACTPGDALAKPASFGSPQPNAQSLPAAILLLPFGVELETVMNVTDARKALDRTTIPQQKPGAAPHTGWQVVYDSGAEFVSPILGAGSYHQVGDVLAAIKAASGHVAGPNRGLHIHLDASDLTADNLLHIIDAFHHGEAVWHGFAGTSVKRRYYCGFLQNVFLEELARNKPQSKDAILQVWDRTHASRYYGLNLEALAKHGTIELRLFEASEDPAYIDRSVALAQQFVTEAKARGKFVDWHNFEQPRERSHDPVAVLNALGFTTSCAGLANMRSKLLEKYALHPASTEVPSEKPLLLYRLQPAAPSQPTPADDLRRRLIAAHQRMSYSPLDVQPVAQTAEAYPFARACAQGDVAAVTALIETATPQQLRTYIDEGDNVALQIAAHNDHPQVVRAIMGAVHDQMGSRSVDDLLASNNFSLFNIDGAIHQIMWEWGSRSPRFRAALTAAEGDGSYQGCPLAALASIVD